MKGIILAGGMGTRLYPVTATINKHLLPIYDKPMIYYPLSSLMLAGIRDVLIITTEQALPMFQALLKDGSDLGISISYAKQDAPNGLAEAFIIGREFLDGEGGALILGDNMFFGHGLPELLANAANRTAGATIFAYSVAEPARYGVLEFDADDKPVAIHEKPADPPSNWAVTGLYFFDKDVPDIAAGVKPSARGELEIGDVIDAYIKRGDLNVEFIGRGFAWLDMGTHESFLETAQFIETIENRQSMKVACLEEVALYRGFIDLDRFTEIAEAYPATGYGDYLKKIAKVRRDG